jgi:hypothetical protein
MTSSLTDRGVSGYFATGGRPDPQYGSATGTAPTGWADSVLEIPTT